MKHLLVLIAALLLSGCAKENSKPQTVPEIAASALQFDGLYQSVKKDDHWSYIRVYQDGTVICVSSSGQPADIQKWFTKDHESVAKGTLTRDGTHLAFSLTSTAGVLDFEGEINGEGLLLNSYSHINENRSTTQYHFVKW